MPSLKELALKGALWSFLERFGQQSFQFIITIILARLLDPKDFGVIGMLSIFLALAQSLVDSGLGAALIQKQETSKEDESTVFWFNVIVSFIVALVVYLLAGPISNFYEISVLQPITKIISISIIINSFGLIHNTLITKNVDFKKRTYVSLFSILVSGVIAIVMAYSNMGVWALVYQVIISAVIRNVLLWFVYEWRPALVFSYKSFRELWKYGSMMLLSGLLDTFFNNIYLVLIGKLYNPADLGFYERGKKIMMLSSQSMMAVISQVTFPILSKINNDIKHVERTFKKILQLTVYIITPVMVGLLVVSYEFVISVFGEKWLPIVPYLQLLCIVGILLPIHSTNLTVLRALGKSKLFFRLEVVKKILVIISILITYRYGVIAMLWGQVGTSILGLYVNSYYTKKIINCGLLFQLRSIWRTMLVSLIMGGSLLWLKQYINLPNVWVLLVETVMGILIYFALSIIMRDPAVLYCKEIIRKRITEE